MVEKSSNHSKRKTKDIAVNPMKDKRFNVTVELERCHDCKADPGCKHAKGCDVERCSVCGGQYLGCRCKGHDRQFARWTGFWPGELEAKALNMDLNSLYLTGVYKLFFIKPNRQ